LIFLPNFIQNPNILNAILLGVKISPKGVAADSKRGTRHFRALFDYLEHANPPHPRAWIVIQSNVRS